MKRIKQLILGSLMVFSLSFGSSLLIAQPINAQSDASKQAVCESLGGCEDKPGESTVTSVLRTSLNLLSLAAGVIAVIMIVIGGLKFITSQGDAGAVSSARNTILYAIVGIVIVLLSQVIVRFVLTEATTVDPPASVPRDRPSLDDPVAD